MKVFSLVFFFLSISVAYDNIETLESSATYCIELCTDICIDKPDVYPCFNDCTMIECSKGNTEPAKVRHSSLDRIGLGILVIAVGALFKVLVDWCSKLRQTPIFQGWQKIKFLVFNLSI